MANRGKERRRERRTRLAGNLRARMFGCRKSHLFDLGPAAENAEEFRPHSRPLGGPTLAVSVSRRRYSPPDIVIITASDDPAFHRHVYAAGAQACLPKPFGKEALPVTIEANLANTRQGGSEPK